jgi:hypothetical protein
MNAADLRTPGLGCSKRGLPPGVRGYIVRRDGVIIGRVWKNLDNWWSYAIALTDNHLNLGAQPRREDAVEMLAAKVEQLAKQAAKEQA